MKNLKHILLFIPLLFLFSACEKEKLEDSERGKALLGKWKYEYGGYQTNSVNFIPTYNPDANFEIEFLEGAKISISNNGVIEEFRIRKFNEVLNNNFAVWKSTIHYGPEKEKWIFEVNYYSQDSIMIDVLPQKVNSPSMYNGLNYFSRIE